MELEHLVKRIEVLESELKHIKENMVLNPKVQEAKEEFDMLKTLVESEHWPTAVDPTLICDVSNEQDKEDRAEGIIDIIIDVHLEGKSLLDYGCGQGHVVNKSLQYKTKVSAGYDVKVEEEHWNKWKNNGNVVLTSNWDEIVANGPYDVVLLYDVLDHLVDESPVDVLKKIKSVCKEDTRLYVRCHPFCSRHGTHLYHNVNKAFVHLVFTDEEMDKLGFDVSTKLPSIKVIHPQAQYNEWFNVAGLRIVKHNFYRDPVEPFFRDTAVVAKRIKRHWQASPDEGLRSGRLFPAPQLEQQFNDYVLKV